MGRKKNTTSEMDVAEKLSAPLTQRLNELITDSNELKDFLGCSIQAVNQYKLGISRPSLENLCKIADFYGVTTDYLLGRTNEPTANIDRRAACDYTGLSSKAVEHLHRLSTRLQKKGEEALNPYEVLLTYDGKDLFFRKRNGEKVFTSTLCGIEQDLMLYISESSVRPKDPHNSDEKKQFRTLERGVSDFGYAVMPRTHAARFFLYEACSNIKYLFRKWGEANGQHQEGD